MRKEYTFLRILYYKRTYQFGVGSLTGNYLAAFMYV